MGLDSPVTGENRIRVIVQQPALPQYRVPLFRELAGRAGIDLEVRYGRVDEIPNAAVKGFKALYSPTRLWQASSWPFRWDASKRRCGNRDSCEVLMLSWNIRDPCLVPALLRARRGGVSTILWGHGSSKQETHLRRSLRWAVARLATAVLFYGNAAALRYVAKMGRPDSTFVALNSLDQTPIQSAKRKWEEDPKELIRFRREEVLTDGPVILFSSRLQRSNRLDLLLEATALLSERHANLQVVIIGSGSVEMGRLATIASRLGLEGRVRFLGEIYEEHRLAPWFLSADVFCYPSNAGLSVLHAFGYGLPVVVSDAESANNPEWEAVRDEVNGLHYAAGNVGSLAHALSRILEYSSFAQSLSAGALRTVATEFTLENMVDGMESAIRYGAERAKTSTKQDR